MSRVFVYGSLLPGGEAFETYLAHDVRAVVPAVLPDHALHGRGLPYPFATPESGCRVVGVVVEVATPEEVLGRLDEYEGDEYVRRRVRVLVDGRPMAVWTYLAAPEVPLGPSTLLPSGEWPGP